MLVDDFVVTNTEVTVGFFDFYGTANYRNYFTQQRRKEEKRKKDLILCVFSHRTFSLAYNIL